MTSPAPGLPSDEVLRRLELAVHRRLDGLLHGDHRGLVPGHGTEAGETRTYQPGDDVRRIDWNVTARTQVPHVRETVADHELEAWVVLDASASLAFGTARCEKRDIALAVVAAVGFLTAQGGNRVGAIVLGPAGTQIVPARSSRGHLQALLARCHAALHGADGPADLAAGLSALGGAMRRRGLAVVVSDFLADGGWHRPLRALAGRHDVLAVEVVDPRELELPHVGVLDLVDPETGRLVEVQTADADLRRRYAAAAAEHRAEVAHALRAAGADHVVLRTDRDWLLDLVRFVARRRDRVAALGREGARR